MSLVEQAGCARHSLDVPESIASLASAMTMSRCVVVNQRGVAAGFSPGIWGRATLWRMAAHITLDGDLKGEYVVDEVLDDGRLVIRPDTSAQAIRRRQGLEPITAEEFEQHFGHLPTDEEG